MSEALVNFFIENLGGIVSKEIIVFIVSLLPILELRGGILAGYLLGLDFVPTFLISFVGNMLPIPFILYFIQFIFKVLKNTPMKKFVLWCEKKAESKSETIRKYAYLGILIFVGIPLPGTGAWTGALIASMLKMDPKKTLPAVALGVLLAGIIVSIFSFGLLNAIGL
ncbi:MAG: small multi-drug export protein [Tyzzerella sp.]|uniref:Small multi-drug export protein n=1 Tax=Candidatus Fimicola merdigallinarum TaxID=2840819 RepID=A0A9D9H4B4_9FIRM|nr:small multi-drug export protein [Candidatus Fimicola merdigallinarum]